MSGWCGHYIQCSPDTNHQPSHHPPTHRAAVARLSLSITKNKLGLLAVQVILLLTFATLGLEERLIGKARERIIISLNQPPTHHIASATDALYTLEMEGKDIKE